MRASIVVIGVFGILGLVPAQEPPEPTPPVPTPPVLVPPRPARVPRAARTPTPAPQPPAPPAQWQVEQASDYARAIEAATDVDRLVAELAETSGLDRETLRPAVVALQAMWASPSARTMLRGRLARAQGQDSEDAERRLAEAVAKLPYDKQDDFVQWAAKKQSEIAELKAAYAETRARGSLRYLLEGQNALEATRRDLLATEALRGQKLPTEKEWEALSQTGKDLAETQQQLAREMETLARARIEGALDKSLWDRHREMAGRVDSERARKLTEDLTHLARRRSLLMTETQPAEGLEKLERQLVELRGQREAIDQAIERATTELVRERAAKLHEEAVRREQAEKARRDAQPEPVGDAEVQKLREELRRLRDEVEALRKKEAKEPK